MGLVRQSRIDRTIQGYPVPRQAAIVGDGRWRLFWDRTCQIRGSCCLRRGYLLFGAFCFKLTKSLFQLRRSFLQFPVLIGELRQWFWFPARSSAFAALTKEKIITAEIKAVLAPDNCLIAPPANFNGHEGAIDAAAVYS